MFPLSMGVWIEKIRLVKNFKSILFTMRKEKKKVNRNFSFVHNGMLSPSGMSFYISIMKCGT